MSGKAVTIKTKIYGNHKRQRADHEAHTEVEMVVNLPADIGNDIAKQANWLKDFIGQDAAVRDLKHSHDWRCEFCDKPAHEVILHMGFWLNTSPAIMQLTLHCLCSQLSMACFDEFDELDRDICGIMGVPWRPQPRLGPPPGGYPLLGACVACRRNDTAGSGVGQLGSLMRCNGCKLTRYCSKECQKSDWRRHKIACKSIKNVMWHLKPPQA